MARRSIPRARTLTSIVSSPSPRQCVRVGDGDGGAGGAASQRSACQQGRGAPAPSSVPPPLRTLQADENKGVTDEQAEALRIEFGYNELPEKKVNPFLMFLSYLWGPMPCMIWAAIIIELVKVGLVGEGTEDVVVLFVLQFANATGTWQGLWGAVRR